MMKILDVENLTVKMMKEAEQILVDSVSFHIKKGECLGLIGASGSGKTMTVKGILDLLNPPFFVESKVTLNNMSWESLKKSEKRKIMAKDIGIILQNPMNAFDPLMRIGKQMHYYLYPYTKLKGEEFTNWLISLLEEVHISHGEDVLKKYPHQLSGGMLQRIMIALSTALSPALIIADEPTTAIDSQTQREILKFLKSIKSKNESGILMVSHDIDAVCSIADRIILMDRGKIVEQSDCVDFLRDPKSIQGKNLMKCKSKLGGEIHAFGYTKCVG